MTSATKWGCGIIRAIFITALAAGMVSHATFAEIVLGTKTPTGYGWTQTYTQDGKEYTAEVYTDTSKTWEFQVPAGVSHIDYLVVAGGGGGGGGSNSGGGGAGGLLEAYDVQVTPNSQLEITVGAGGATAPGQTKQGINGENSSISNGVTEIACALGGGGSGGAAYKSNQNKTSGKGGNGVVILRYTISTEPQTIDEVIEIDVAEKYLDFAGESMAGKSESYIREELKKKAVNGYTFAENIELGIAQETTGNFVNKPYLNSVGSEEDTISFAFGNVTPNVSDAKITYIVEAASSPSATEWTQESSATMTTGEERGRAALPSAESGASAVKYYRVRFTVEQK